MKCNFALLNAHIPSNRYRYFLLSGTSRASVMRISCHATPKEIPAGNSHEGNNGNGRVDRVPEV
jgi:hypothetical protein